MGDRGNIVMEYQRESERQRVYFYAHWAGCDLPQLLQDALKKRWRWDDDTYLARIIFDTMTATTHGQETGFGIAPFLTDNEHDLLVVFPDKKMVYRETEQGTIEHEWTFEEFCKLDIQNVFSDY